MHRHQDAYKGLCKAVVVDAVDNVIKQKTAYQNSDRRDKDRLQEYAEL